MEKNIDGKMKSVASIPANYVSILQLQERWLKEKGRKQIDKDSEVKQQQQVDDEQVKAMEPKVKLDEKGLGAGFRMHGGDNHRKKEPNCVEVSATASKKKEDGVKKKKWSKNKSGSVEKVVKCESKAYVPTENSPVKEESRRVFTSKRENTSKGSISVESQIQDLCIEKRVEEEGREVKGPERLNSGQGYERNQRHGWSSRREIRATGTMVWVKKGKDDGSAGENGV